MTTIWSTKKENRTHTHMLAPTQHYTQSETGCNSYRTRDTCTSKIWTKKMISVYTIYLRKICTLFCAGSCEQRIYSTTVVKFMRLKVTKIRTFSEWTKFVVDHDCVLCSDPWGANSDHHAKLLLFSTTYLRHQVQFNFYRATLCVYRAVFACRPVSVCLSVTFVYYIDGWRYRQLLSRPGSSIILSFFLPQTPIPI